MYSIRLLELKHKLSEQPTEYPAMDTQKNDAVMRDDQI